MHIAICVSRTTYNKESLLWKFFFVLKTAHQKDDLWWLLLSRVNQSKSSAECRGLRSEPASYRFPSRWFSRSLFLSAREKQIVFVGVYVVFCFFSQAWKRCKQVGGGQACDWPPSLVFVFSSLKTMLQAGRGQACDCPPPPLPRAFLPLELRTQAHTGPADR